MFVFGSMFPCSFRFSLFFIHTTTEKLHSERLTWRSRTGSIKTACSKLTTVHFTIFRVLIHSVIYLTCVSFENRFLHLRSTSEKMLGVANRPLLMERSQLKTAKERARITGLLKVREAMRSTSTLETLITFFSFRPRQTFFSFSSHVSFIFIV